MVYDDSYDSKFRQGYKESIKHIFIKVICHVCGKRWKHILTKGEQLHSVPSDIDGVLLVNCNLDITPPIHSDKQISESWRQIYTRQKELGQRNKLWA